MSHMQCECDMNMMMSCLHHANVKQTIMMWCSSNVDTNDIMPPHSNMNATDIMMMWFALYANPSAVTSGMHDACMHACMAHMLYVELTHLSI